MKNSQQNVAEWASKDEAIRTSIPIYVVLGLLKYSPKFVVNFAIKCTSIFYYLFGKRAREECVRYQEQLLKAAPNSIKKISIYRQIEAFAITFLEKVECWVKPEPTIKLELCDDDIQQLIDRLNSGKGAFLMCSHLGNSEIFRNLANINKIYLSRNVPVSVLMDLGSTSNFTNTLKKVNPEFVNNIIDVNNITPGTMEILSETIEKGGLVVCAGDRVSKFNDSKNVIAPFMKKDAPWPYGVYLMTMLLKAPVYYIFGLRKRDNGFDRKYEFRVKKSTVNTDCARKERETKINELCLEFAGELEKACKDHPFQWFNFYDFWNIPGKE